MGRCMWRAAIVSAALLWGAALASAQHIEGLHGKAAAAIEADIRASGFMSPVQAYVFYGDLTGRGTNDAVAILYHPTGGNSDQITKWLYWDDGAGYSRASAPALEDVFGIEPRNVKLSPGRIEITMTVMNPGDPRCCPTGKKTYVISPDGRGKAGAASGGGGWTASAATNPVGVTIEASSTDQRSRIIGMCATSGIRPGFWLTFFHEGDALNLTDKASEVLLITIGGRSGLQEFSASTLYYAASDAWVADWPLPEKFLNAFAAGDEMRITRGADDRELARFGLRGTARAVNMMRKVCGPAVIAADERPVALPFADGRYLSDASLCGLDDSQIIDRIGDEIHYSLYEIRNGKIGYAEALCDVRDVSRQGDMVRMNAECAEEGMFNSTELEMTYLSENAFRAGERVFARCE